MPRLVRLATAEQDLPSDRAPQCSIENAVGMDNADWDGRDLAYNAGAAAAAESSWERPGDLPWAPLYPLTCHLSRRICSVPQALGKIHVVLCNG